VDQQIAVAVRDQSQVGEARRRAAQLCQQCGLPEADAGRLAIVVTELGNNLVKHASGGELLLRALTAAGGVEVLAVDKGPGIRDLSESLRDGYSTAGTPGTGLGALRRLSDQFDIYSGVGQGTVVLSRVLPRSRNGPPPWHVGVVSMPIRGEHVSGDAWMAQPQGGRQLFMVADGVGHGVIAAEAAQEAGKVLQKYADRDLHEIMEAWHFALRKTRGAAIAVASINPLAGELRYIGVGNISGSVFTADGTRSMVSHNGTVGHVMSRVQEFQYPFAPGATLLMYSDGLATIHLEKYPGLMRHHPSVIAGVLYRDFTRGRDDVTVLVAREFSR
jgi:anti-sigma regulatory factor (Ser/Thr protein kinase)